MTSTSYKNYSFKKIVSYLLLINIFTTFLYFPFVIKNGREYGICSGRYEKYISDSSIGHKFPPFYTSDHWWHFVIGFSGILSLHFGNYTRFSPINLILGWGGVGTMVGYPIRNLIKRNAKSVKNGFNNTSYSANAYDFALGVYFASLTILILEIISKNKGIVLRKQPKYYVRNNFYLQKLGLFIILTLYTIITIYTSVKMKETITSSNSCQK
tara:strand:- start:146 stop:781 length:636 start_codon:yes stop_codon:yes gene_type:complete